MVVSSRRRWCLRLAISLALGACLAVRPAAAQYRVDHWTTDDGLPQNSVLALLQTGDGYLWAATPDGRVRFDGLRFTIFNKATTAGLTTNRFCALFESQDGALWIGTEDRGAVRYRNGTFETFESGLPDHLSGRVQNTGTVAFPNGAALWFYVTGPNGFSEFVGSTAASGLAPGATSSYSFDWLIPRTSRAGRYTYGAILRYNSDSISQWSFTQEFTVRPAAAEHVPRQP